MTPSGFASLQAELRDLKKNQRPQITETVAWAASNGDRSENGDYIYGKKKLREIDKRIRYLMKRLDAAEVIDPALIKSDEVKFGATVTFLDEEGEEKSFTIVGEAEVTACCSLKLKTLGTMLTANEIKVFEQALHENSRRKHLKNALFEAAHMVYSIIQTSFTRTHLCFLLPLMQSSTDPHEIVSADQVCRFISSELEKPPHRDCSNELLEEILSQARTLYPEYGNKILGQLDFRNALSRVVIKFGSLHSNQLSTSNIRDLAVALDAISQSRERLFCSLSSLVASLSYPAKAAETLEQFLSSYGRFFSTPPTDDREALYQRIIIDNKDIRSLEDIVEVLEAVSEFLFTQGLDPKSITRITIKE